MLLQPQFIETPHGRILLTAWLPDSPATRSILIVPPFGEEMNKCRPMMSALARRIATAGDAALLVDLYGTGDSDGDLMDTSVERWRDDLKAARDWAARQGAPVNALVAIRFGALLAASSAALIEDVRTLMFWQPVVSGELALTQLLRIRVAASALSSAGKRETVPELLAELDQGGSIEVAGYRLTGQLAAGVRELALNRQTPGAHTVVRWLEVSPQPPVQPGRATQQVVDGWVASGLDVQYEALAGESFWTSTEIVHCEPLIDHSMALLSG